MFTLSDISLVNSLVGNTDVLIDILSSTILTNALSFSLKVCTDISSLYILFNILAKFGAVLMDNDSPNALVNPLLNDSDDCIVSVTNLPNPLTIDVS